MGGNGILGLNGGLEAAIATVRRLWKVGVAMFALVVVVFTCAQAIKKLEAVPAMQRSLARIEAYQHDSLMTNADQAFLMDQMLRRDRNMDNRIRKLEHRPIQEGLGRWEYFSQYGPMPERYRLYFDPDVPSKFLAAKAAGQ